MVFGIESSISFLTLTGCGILELDNFLGRLDLRFVSLELASVSDILIGEVITLGSDIERGSFLGTGNVDVTGRGDINFGMFEIFLVFSSLVTLLFELNLVSFFSSFVTLIEFLETLLELPLNLFAEFSSFVTLIEFLDSLSGSSGMWTTLRIVFFRS